MKLNTIIRYGFISLFAVLAVASCKKDDIKIEDETDNLKNLKLITTLKNGHHDIELYNKDGHLKTGYNEVFFQIKNEFGAALVIEKASWTPMMDMHGMSHSSPASAIAKYNANQFINTGYIIFTMPGGDMGQWHLKINYTINSETLSAEGLIDVNPTTRRNVQNFTGTDSLDYILALIEPIQPKEGSNEMKAALYLNEHTDTYTPLENYTILIDPRMPGMGNHGSPNNTDLVSTGKGIYEGQVNFSMTGYWKINLQVKNEQGDLIKGEEVNEENESSSIFLEIEF